MKINEIILETVQDDHVINASARATADFIVRRWDSNFRPYLYGVYKNSDEPHAYAQELSFANKALAQSDNPLYNRLGNTRVYVSYVPGGQQAVAGRFKDGFIIRLNYKQLTPYRNNIEDARYWLVETLAHEIRHVLDRIYRDASASKVPHNFNKERYYQKPHMADEPDTTPSEVNAYFTQILSQVENDLKMNKITDLNRALKFGQDSLKDSQLVDAIFGEWDSSNPVLRRLSARMSQFVHSLFNKAEQ